MRLKATQHAFRAMVWHLWLACGCFSRGCPLRCTRQVQQFVYGKPGAWRLLRPGYRAGAPLSAGVQP